MITKEKCIEMVDNYMAAEIDVLAGKQVMIGGRMMQSENLNEIRKGRSEWERRLNAFTKRHNGPRVIRFN